MARIPVAGPWTTDKEVEYVADAASNGWYGNANLYQRRCEEAFAACLGVRYAVSLPSCTSAIHFFSLLALGVGPGDEATVPDITWIASAAPLSYVGATPVFADTDEHTCRLSASVFEECLASRTKAVIIVDLYGGVADYDAIRAVADRHGIAFIEDAAGAIDSGYRGRRAGNVGVFSLHGSKDTNHRRGRHARHRQHGPL